MEERMLDRREIMKAAWTSHREGVERRAARRLQGETFPAESKLFANALRTAWRHAKDALARSTPDPVIVSPVSSALFDLNTKDRWTAADYRRADELRAERQVAA
jgi:hypothetical protein